jgi:hypothetical protein
MSSLWQDFVFSARTLSKETWNNNYRPHNTCIGHRSEFSHIQRGEYCYVLYRTKTLIGWYSSSKLQPPEPGRSSY